MLTIAFIINSCVSIALVIIGWQIWKKGNSSLLHTYNYDKSNEKQYCEEIGRCITTMGISCGFFGLGDLVEINIFILVCLGVLLFIFFGAFIKMIKVQKKYSVL